MLKVNDELRRKTGQMKVKRNRRHRSTDNNNEIIALPSTVEIKCTLSKVILEPEKIVTDFAVALQKVEYWSYQPFFGFR